MRGVRDFLGGWFVRSGLLAAALTCLGTNQLPGQGIVIEGADWESFTMATLSPTGAKQLCADRATPIVPYAFVCQTTNGVPFMALAGRCPTVTYTLEVSSLPDGKTRFPIALSMRMIGNPSGARLNIHNETTASYISMQLPFRGGVGTARDDQLSEAVSFNPQAQLPAGELYDSTDPADVSGRAPSVIATQAVTLALALGKNVIRFDACKPEADGDHGQFFRLAIGEEEPDLAGAIVTGCSVFRSVSPQTYMPGQQLAVQLACQTLPAGTTVVEEIPAGMLVADAGGGLVGAGVITFSPPMGASDLTYVLDPAQVCDVSTFLGTYTSPSACEGTVAGEGKVRCVGSDGIRLRGDDFLKFESSDPPIEPDPCNGQIQICTTTDGVGFIYPTTPGVRLFSIKYLLNVQELPGGVGTGRVRVALNARRISGTSGVFGIRNVTNGTWIGFTVAPSTCSAGCDSGEVDEDLSNVNKATLATDATDPLQGGVAPEWIISETATIGLDLGVNEIAIENFGPRLNDDGDIAQVFAVAFGPNQPELQGGLCAGGLPTTVIDRTIDPASIAPGGLVTVTLAATGVTQPLELVETYPAAYVLESSGNGTPDEANRTITFAVAADGTLSYTLLAPPTPCGTALFEGVASTSAGGCDRKAVTGDVSITCGMAAPECPPPPDAPEFELVRAFAFGTHPTLPPGEWCASYNAPEAQFTPVAQIAGDPLSIGYTPGKGFGYEELHAAYAVDPATPYGDLAGWEVYGPIDDSPNDRSNVGLGQACGEVVYASFIGGKNFLAACDASVVGNPNDPCPVPDGLIFRADVPNGTYRFVLACGDAANVHSHRILAEDGGSGPPSNIGTHVVLVAGFDQGQYGIGMTDPQKTGEAVFARVGFDGKLPPPADGIAPDPVFVNMDADGAATSECADSPALEVTSGYVRIHQLQFQQNAGCGGTDAGAVGGDLVMLELWKKKAAVVTTTSVLVGNVNTDKAVNIADAIALLAYLFAQKAPPLCAKAADANDDDQLNIADAITILGFLFSQKPMFAPDGSTVTAANNTCTPYATNGVDNNKKPYFPATIGSLNGCGTPCVP